MFPAAIIGRKGISLVVVGESETSRELTTFSVPGISADYILGI